MRRKDVDGVYDITNNEAIVNVGISHDTAEFAVESIRLWWARLGRKRYPHAMRLLVTADSGGSNSPGTRLWRWCLQQFATETGLEIELCHYPPGTSKLNKIEHRLFCHITRNWQGVPLETHEIVVNLIGSTRTEKGLEVHAWLDENNYQKSKKVTDAQLQEVRIRRNDFHGMRPTVGLKKFTRVADRAFPENTATWRQPGLVLLGELPWPT